MSALPATIIDNLDRGRTLFRDSPLLADGDVQIGYREFAELVEGAGSALAAAGLLPGDRLALCARNGLDAAVAIWACARRGFIFVGLPTHLGADGWHALLRHASPKLALAQPEFLADLPETVLPLEDRLSGLRRRWDDSVPMPEPDDVYALVYTSGTTGVPKGVMVTHRASMHVAGFYRRLLQLTPRDVTAIHLPFSYVSGHISQLNPFMLAGASGITMPSFSAKSLIEVTRRHRVTVLDVVPWMFSMLLRDPRFAPQHLPSLRAAIFGGSPTSPGVMTEVRALFPQLRLHNVYGMSETAGLIGAIRDGFCDPRDDTVGRPADGVEVNVNADEEILVRGPVVTPGYWQNQSATDSAIRDGWLHTGDRGAIDADGRLHVHDRLVDLINRGGVKIAPADIEYVLHSHPDVAAVAAFGLPDGAAGQVAAAAVIPAAGRNLAVEELRKWANHRLPVHARPRSILIVEEFPRNPNGKVDLSELRRRSGAG